MEQQQQLSYPQDAELFRDHPGYALIMEHLPRVLVAVCGGPYCAPTNNHPFHAPEMALRNLLALYDNLLLWEQNMEKLNPRDATSAMYAIHAATDFPLAVDLLITHLHVADPCAVDYNAAYIGGLVEMYSSTRRHAAEDTLTRVKNYGHW